MGRASVRKCSSVILSRCVPCAISTIAVLFGRSLFLKKVVPIWSVKGTLFLWDPFYPHCKAPSHVALKVYVYEFYRTCASELASSVRPSVAKGFHTLALHLGNEAWAPSCLPIIMCRISIIFLIMSGPKIGQNGPNSTQTSSQS